MSPFEYVTVLISIVLGLGITEILTGIASIIHKRDKVIVYWPHLLWILFILFLQVQEWWIMYELKSYHPWRLAIFLFIMLYPVNLFVLAKLLFPKRLKGENKDLKKFYFENYTKIFLLLVLSALLSILYNLFILDLTIADQALQIILAISFTIIIVRRYSSELLHKAIAVMVIAMMVLSIVVEWDKWLVT